MAKERKREREREQASEDHITQSIEAFLRLLIQFFEIMAQLNMNMPRLFGSYFILFI